jgi:hypothetical protein
MEDLKRLVQIIIKRKQRQYPLLELKGVTENSSKENIFFRYIKNGTIDGDEEAANLLYGAAGDDDRYRMLKSRLKQKLLNHLFFLDFTENNQKLSHQYEQECIQYLHQARMLIFTGERKVARNLVQKAQTIAERCEYTRHLITSLEELMRLYSENHQPHLFESTVEELHKARQLYQKEQEAEELYYYITMMVVKSVNSRKKNIDKAQKSIRQIEKLWNETKSFNIFEYHFKLAVLYKKLVGEFSDVIPLLEDLDKGKYNGQSLNEFRIDPRHVAQEMAYALLRTNQIERGLEYVEEKLPFFDQLTNEWFDIYETYFMLAIHGRNYRLAFQVIDQVFENKLFVKLEKEVREKWRLYNAYLHYAYSGNFYMRNFNFSDFIEKIPEYDKDKEGFNVAVIILQFLFNVERGDMQALAKERDALKEYMANHFKENFSYRTRTFYKLLNIVVENKLDMKKIQAKTRYLTNKLQEASAVGDSFAEMEIIPYEHLWELMMNMVRYFKIRQPA